MRLSLAVVLLVLLAACERPSHSQSTMAQPRTPSRSPEALSLARVAPRETGAVLEVISDAVDANGALDLRHTSYGANLSPPLRWTPVDGARTYAIALEDPDAARERPFVHWMIWNIPGDLDWLP